ncbi:MAG TPA: O-antigen ligase family protein [Flavobacteriales bacterium]|nr:O-antigen ligase family protein [Flavobacteriales bacterium]
MAIRFNLNTNPASLKWMYAICFVFIALNAAIISQGWWWSLLIPAGLLIALFCTFSLDKLLFLAVFLTPLSVSLEHLDFGTSISLPAEPLMLLLSTIFIIQQLYKGDYDTKVILHPITILVLINLMWMALTSITSDLPLVSFKYLVSRIWFLVPFYFFSISVFRYLENIKRFLWMYIIPLILVIGYASFGLIRTGFDEELSQSVMTPFYPSHTAYGAIIAMFLPFVFTHVLTKEKTRLMKVAGLFVLFCFCFAILFSYSRAVWVSLPAALGLYLLIIFKIKVRTVLIAIFVIVGFLVLNKEQIMIALEKNKQDSSEEFVENFQSISNISTDDSNTERINRWSSAIAMFKERPIFGWGPGTYQFKYAPFQLSKNMTLISTNAGDLGNAHSEYIGPLSESGLLGGVSFLLIAIYSLYIGIRLYLNAKREEVRFLSLSVVLGLSTYFIHGFLNNYLDTDKASVPFWGFIAIITALDIYHSKNPGHTDRDYPKG